MWFSLSWLYLGFIGILGSVDLQWSRNLRRISATISPNICSVLLSYPSEIPITYMLDRLLFFHRLLRFCSFFMIIFSLSFNVDNFYCSVLKFTDLLFCLFNPLLSILVNTQFLIQNCIFSFRYSIWLLSYHPFPSSLCLYFVLIS